MSETPTPGMRVRWGQAGADASWTGTMVCEVIDEDEGGPLLCGSCEPPLPCWVIRFDNGKVKSRCCISSILEVLHDPQNPA